MGVVMGGASDTGRRSGTGRWVVPELVHRGSSVSSPDQACGHWPLASPDQQLQLLLLVKQQRSK